MAVKWYKNGLGKKKVWKNFKLQYVDIFLSLKLKVGPAHQFEFDMPVWQGQTNLPRTKSKCSAEPLSSRSNFLMKWIVFSYEVVESTRSDRRENDPWSRGLHWCPIEHLSCTAVRNHWKINDKKNYKHKHRRVP